MLDDQHAGDFWIVRGTMRGEDVAIVVEAESRERAECMGWKRGIEVVVVSQATDTDVQGARDAKLLWRYTPGSRYQCLGRPVRPLQLATLLLCGLITALLNLHASGVLF